MQVRLGAQREKARAFQADKFENVYLVPLTGYARPEDIEKVKEAGFYHHPANLVDGHPLCSLL